jgi:hypothetical protein
MARVPTRPRVPTRLMTAEEFFEVDIPDGKAEQGFIHKLPCHPPRTQKQAGISRGPQEPWRAPAPGPP